VERRTRAFWESRHAESNHYRRGTQHAAISGPPKARGTLDRQVIEAGVNITKVLSYGTCTPGKNLGYYQALFTGKRSDRNSSCAGERAATG